MADGRWITTKKGRHVFIPEGKDVDELLKEKFGDDGDSEDIEFDYSKYDIDQEEEFNDTPKYTKQPDGTIEEDWSKNKYIDEKDLEEQAGPEAKDYIEDKEEENKKSLYQEYADKTGNYEPISEEEFDNMTEESAKNDIIDAYENNNMGKAYSILKAYRNKFKKGIGFEDIIDEYYKNKKR